MSTQYRRASLLAVLTALVLFSSQLFAQGANPARPKITGVSNIGFFVSDLPKAVAFWHDFLGYDVEYTLPAKDSGDTRVAVIKINNHQHIELFNEPPANPPNRMHHICFTVDNANAMQSYLRSKGIDTKPGSGARADAGDYAFAIADPDGVRVEFVQSKPGSMESKAKGKFLPATRISDSIYHAGFFVGNSQKSIDFYGKVLGFHETWRGGDHDELKWIKMQVPDGADNVEFMLYRKLPTGSYGVWNHLSLLVPDAAKAVAILEARPAFKVYGKELKVNTGLDLKRQVNIYDPDGTRVELMEDRSVTGKPAPSMNFPPPPPSHD